MKSISKTMIILGMVGGLLGFVSKDVSAQTTFPKIQPISPTLTLLPVLSGEGYMRIITDASFTLSDPDENSGAATCDIDVGNLLRGDFNFTRPTGQIGGYYSYHTTCQFDFSKVAATKVVKSASVDDVVPACVSINCHFIWEDDNGKVVVGRIKPVPPR